MSKSIKIYKLDDFDNMHSVGKLASKTLDFIKPYIIPGISTNYINELCHNFIVENGAIPAPLNYKGFPKSICTSVNQVVCHGIPSKEQVLCDGDIINIDVTLILNGWYGDTSRTFTVGKVNSNVKKLIKVTHDSMLKGIEMIRPGVKLGDIGYTIQSYVESYNFSVVRDFCGHGIGKVFHDAPNVLHFGVPGDGLELKEGMFFTVEPMVNMGDYHVKILDDGWTVVTGDGSLSAQFEHSVGVTENGYDIFTES